MKYLKLFESSLEATTASFSSSADEKEQLKNAVKYIQDFFLEFEDDTNFNIDYCFCNRDRKSVASSFLLNDVDFFFKNRAIRYDYFEFFRVDIQTNIQPPLLDQLNDGATVARDLRNITNTINNLTNYKNEYENILNRINNISKRVPSERITTSHVSSNKLTFHYFIKSFFLRNLMY